MKLATHKSDSQKILTTCSECSRMFYLLLNDLVYSTVQSSAQIKYYHNTGLFWSEVKKMTTLDRQPRFNLLHQLMAGLSIPVSNANSEHGFSMLRKIHTDQRANLDQSTIMALMGMKFYCDDCCYDIKHFTELLSVCKESHHFVRFSCNSSRAIYLNIVQFYFLCSYTSICLCQPYFNERGQ